MIFISSHADTERLLSMHACFTTVTTWKSPTSRESNTRWYAFRKAETAIMKKTVHCIKFYGKYNFILKLWQSAEERGQNISVCNKQNICMTYWIQIITPDPPLYSRYLLLRKIFYSCIQLFLKDQMLPCLFSESTKDYFQVLTHTELWIVLSKNRATPGKLTLSLSSVFCEVLEAIEIVSGWLLPSPWLSRSSPSLQIVQFSWQY